MVVQENVKINGVNFIYTHSDSGYKIERNGETYDSVYDPVGFENERVYTETNIPVTPDLPDPVAPKQGE